MAEEIATLDSSHLPRSGVPVDEHPVVCLLGARIPRLRVQADVENIRVFVMVTNQDLFGLLQQLGATLK